jgi:hypothetical protein
MHQGFQVRPRSSKLTCVGAALLLNRLPIRTGDVADASRCHDQGGADDWCQAQRLQNFIARI